MKSAIFIALAAATMCIAPALAQVDSVTLRVAMYPFVPQFQDLFHTLESEFERTHPGVNVELVEDYTNAQGELRSLSADYYRGGLEQADADIYEIDTVLLADMASKLQPMALDSRAFRPDFGDAVKVNGQTLGVPHWVCGNFLFYRRGDVAMRDAKDWSELAHLLNGGTGILADLKGTLTLGEWYLTALASQNGRPNTVLAKLAEATLDRQSVTSLQALLGLCPAGYCRSDALHDRVGFYGRMFARGRSRGYIGYSETLHYTLREIGESCSPTDGCLRPDDVAVRALPLDTIDGRHVGWLDALGVDRRLAGRNRQLANEFVADATSWAMYKRVLTPQWPDPPRYLLPARTRPDGDLKEAPLYPEFEAAFRNRLFLTGAKLNTTLRARAGALNCELPPDRNDFDWESSCKRP